MPGCHKTGCKHYHSYLECVDCTWHQNVFDRRYDRYEPKEVKPRIVFLSHPYRSDPEDNLVRCTDLCRRLAKEHPDVTIISPLHAFGWLGEESRGRIMDWCRRMIEIADEVWLAPGWEDSDGCQQEAEWGRRLGKEIRRVMPYAYSFR